MKEYLASLKVGDEVTRMLGGLIPMVLTITNITENTIECGLWIFNKETGIEIDDEIAGTVSHLIKPKD